MCALHAANSFDGNHLHMTDRPDGYASGAIIHDGKVNKRTGGRAEMMGKRSDYKKMDELAAWDLDKGCRRIVDQSTPTRRRLRDKLKRQARKKVNDTMKKMEDSE